MKLYIILTTALNRFRNKSLNHPISFLWDGSAMKLYQNGATFVMSDLFTGCFMPNRRVKGIILPKDIDNFIDAQNFMDNNSDDIIISPIKWGYKIYKINKKGGNPLLVKELKFYSIKGKFPLFITKLLFPKIRVALKNV